MSNTTYTALIIGSGFSGLAMAIKLKDKGIEDFAILEKASEVGGTWRENTYPGAECDIPSALYSYSFEPYPHWEYKWSMQPQILEYIHTVVQKYGLQKHLHFQKEMVSAKWEEANGRWATYCKDGSVYYSKLLITAIGQLHHPSTPKFKGADSFERPSWHSARWNHDVDLKGKTIGVIGNAASAVQFIPEIAKVAEKVVVYQRSANWMLPKQDRAYREWEKKLVARFPFLLKIYRLRIWLLGGGLFFLMKNGNHLLRNLYQKKTINFIKEHIKEDQKVNALIPKYPMGAKRILFSDTYYPALAQNNVELNISPIREITKTGIKTEDESERVLDVLVYATGFKTNPFLLGLDIKGRNEVSIKDYWKEGPKNYLGITIHNFPNLFLMYGPNTNLGHNSIIIMSEAQASYIAECASTMKKNGWNSLEIKEKSLEDYHEQSQKRLGNMIWAQVDNSWYKSESGNIPNNYAGRTMEYMRATKKVNFKDYIIS